MAAIESWLDWISEILTSIFDFVVDLGNLFSFIFESIKYVIDVLFSSIDILTKLSEYFPSFVWAPIWALLLLVIVFRVISVVRG